MSSSGRADGRTGTPRDGFPMPRDSSFSCTSESGKDKRRERDVFTRRVSSSISLEGGTLANKRRPAPFGGSELASYSGRSGGVSSNGWHDDVISRSKNLVDSGTRGGSGSSVGGIAPPSPRLDCSSADDSPKELDGHRFSKPSSPLLTQSRISPLAQASHNSSTGKGILAREHSRCSEWDSPFKMDMDYRDKIWSRSEILKRTVSSSYEAATVLNMHKDIVGRREHDGYGGSGDSTGSSSYHLRSYQEWRQGDRIASSALPLRTHVSNNGYLKDSAAREQGMSDVLGSYSSNWNSPHSSPVNYTVDGGRDDGSQTSPRKRPRLGWGQGLAKYEKKISGGAEDSLATKGRTSSCSDEILLSHSDSPYQGTGHGQEALSTKADADGSGGACVEVDTDIPAIQMDGAACPSIGDETEKNGEFGSMPASEIVVLDSCKSSDASFVSKQCQNNETSIQMQPQKVLPGQFDDEEASGRLKANILQRLEKLELELDLTEKEHAKLKVQPEVHFSGNVSTKNDLMVDVARNSVVAGVQPDVLIPGQKDGAGKVMYTTEVRESEIEVIDDQIGVSSSRIQENSLCLHSKADSKLQSSCEVHCSSSFDSLPTVSVTSKGEDGIIQADGYNSQRSSLKGSSQSAASFSDPGEMTGVIDSKEVNAENLLENGAQFSNITMKPGISIKKETSECWKDVYNDNQKQAEHASQVLANLLPDDKIEPGKVSVGKLKDMLSQDKSMESKERIKQLQDMLLQEKMFLRFREQVLALKYRALRETWKHEQAGLCQWSDRPEGFKKCDTDRRNGMLTPSQRTSHRLRLSGTGKMDAASDEVHTMQKLLAEPLGGYQRPNLKMPCQILDEKERSIQRFITNNALIEDPVAFEKERKTINPWTTEEKKIFLDTFFLYNKNFQKIASFIEHKTVADCIEFYYRNQKSEEFEMVRRRQQLKNRRDYSRPSTYLATMAPPSNRRREITAISIDNLPDPVGLTLYSDNGGVCQNSLSKNTNNNQIGSVDSSNFDNPPGNAGSVTGRNVTTEHSNKVKAVQSPRPATTITEEFDSQWTDHERQLFVAALGMFGKDFKNISQHVATKSEGQCRAFFSKTRKRLGLDQVLETFQMSMHECSEQVGGDTEDFKTAAALEDSRCRDMGGREDDVKDVIRTNVGEHLPSDCDAIAGIVSANSTEEPLITESKAIEKGEEKQNIEDERSTASIKELKNDLPENSKKNDLKQDIEEITENAVEVIPPSFPEPLSELKDEEADYPVVTTDLVAEPEADFGCVGDTKDQQKAYVDEQHPNTLHSKSGREDETSESASVVDAFERPAVEEKVLQQDLLSQVRQESPDVTHISHSSSNQTSVTPINTNASIAAPMAQPKAKGNTSAGESKPRREATSWTQDEKEKFVDIIRKHGRDWTRLQESLPAKSMTQIKTYFQNSKAKLGFTVGEGTNSRSAANRKQKGDDSESINTLYHHPHHKTVSLSDESGLKSDQIVNGSISTMLGAPGSDGLSFTLFGKGKWQAEDTTDFSGMQFQQMGSNGYTQQSVSSNGLFQLFQPSALPVLTTSGFQQPQNLILQHSLSHSTSSKPQLGAPLQTQQIAGVQQSQTSSALCNLQTQVVNQIKQQQKPSQVIAHCQQDYQNQGNQQLQKWIMQQQVAQSFQPKILPSVLQQQQPSQPQVILQQQNQTQHLSQGSHHVQHAITQNFNYLQQQSSIQSFGQLAAVASQQLSSNPQKLINQHQIPSQQKLMNQLQLHYDDQQKQYHLVQSNQLSQQQQQQQPHQHQHSILGSLQEQLVLQLHHHQQHLQSEKQQQPIWTNLPIHMHDNPEVSHHQQVQTPDILSEKEKKQRQELLNCQSVALHKGAAQVISKDASNLTDTIEPKTVPKSQHHESGHSDSQVHVQVLAHSQSKPGAFADSHQTRAGDVKLFGQVLLSQPTSCMNITPSSSENVFSQPAFSLSSVPPSTIVVSVSEGLPDTFPDGTPCVSSSLGRIGHSFAQGHGYNLPWQSTSVGSFGGRNISLDGRQLACLTKRADSENDMQNSQVALSRLRLLREAKEFDNSCPEGPAPSQKFEGCEQLKKMQDNQNVMTGLGIKRSIDQGNGLVINGDLSTSNSDLKSDMPQVSGIADLSCIMNRNKDPDLSSTMGAMLGVPVSSSQSLPGTIIDAHLAIADWHSSRELRFGGGHSSKELHQSQDLPGNKVCHSIDAGKLVITNNQPLALAHSFAGGVENSQFTRENSFFGQQAILHGPGNVGLNMSTWNSVTSVGNGTDLHRVNMPTASSVWAHGSMIVESQPSQPRAMDSRDAEDNKRNTE